VRERVTALVREAGAGALEADAPATPGWRARDVLAHLVGVAADVVEGRLDGVTTEPWTEAQVAARRERSIDDVLDEWEALEPRLFEIMGAVPATVTGQMIFDAVTHEHDLRQAVGAPGARDSDAVRVAFDWSVEVRTSGKLPAAVYDVDLPGGSRVVTGAGTPLGTLRGTRFDIVRAISGRRTAAELEQMGWEGAAADALAAPLFTVRTTSLDE
jgi:uncharacterized protein (TIGR03083 family)